MDGFLSSEIFFGIVKTLLGLWWIWLTFLTGWIFLSLWMAWRQSIYKSSQSWSLLDIKLPREARRSCKAMEQIMMNIWALRNTPGNIREWYWEGETTLWYSFEIVSFGGEIHFYLRTPSRYVNIIKANFYGHYPDCEVEEVDDYLDRLPKTVPELYENGYDIFGLEMFLAKNNAYPIRTYLEFESDEESQNIDPLAGLLEVLAKIQPEEIVMMQLVARPMSVNPPDVLVRLAKKEIEVLKEKFGGKKLKATGVEAIAEVLTSRSPGETDIMKHIEAKATKNAFETMVRYIYLAPRETFSIVLPYRGLRISFQQFAIPNSNHFDVNYKTWTRAWMWEAPYLFTKRVVAGRKARIWDYYRNRRLPQGTFMGKLAQFHIFTSTFTQRISLLNTEELATLWHLPTQAVLTQPILRRLEAKKLGPPAGLPIFREGEEGLPGLMR